ncbi:histidine kinase [Micromonospora sonneratiae]|uniref:histidine kinase n=2 Tax=Micromonospora sonneratiae TaxID=1184706 RepID=A0ABW3YRC4_9ACTN
MVPSITGWVRAHWQLVVDLATQGLLAGLFLVSGVASTTGDPVSVALSAAAILPLLLRRRAPGTVLAVVALATSAHMLMGMSRTVGYMPALLAVYTAATSRTPLVRWGMSLAAATAVAVASLPGRGPVEGYLLAVVAFALAWLAGAERAHQLRRRMALVAERSRLRLEQRITEENLASAEQRERLARRLHDTLAHTITVMLVQTEALRYTGPLEPAQRDRVDRVLDAGRAALTEIRRTITELDSRAVATATDDLHDRLDGLRTAGLDLPATLPTELGELAGPVLTVAHRLLGEVATNALRHDGPGTRLEIQVRRDANRLRVTTLSIGGPPAVRPTPRPPVPGGYGLRSLRRDIEAYGGMLSYGRLAPDRWRVVATFPLVAGQVAPSQPMRQTVRDTGRMQTGTNLEGGSGS